MDGTLGLVGCTHDGGGVPSGGSTTGRSNLTMSKEDKNNNGDMIMSAEVCSSYSVDDDGDLELGLGLSIGGGSKTKAAGASWGQNVRILTAKDFSSSLNISNSSNETSVVGWPPIRRAHRMSTFVNQHAKPPTEEHTSTADENESTNGSNKYCKGYQTVKVNMDGTPIGRKVDLNAHTSYQMLAHTLHHMFSEQWSSRKAAGPSNMLDEKSEFVLTYEDRDGDYMLVGDVPWQMFLSSVKRLRILRNSDSGTKVRRKEEETKNN